MNEFTGAYAHFLFTEPSSSSLENCARKEIAGERVCHPAAVLQDLARGGVYSVVEEQRAE
jgi:hypothetical protein